MHELEARIRERRRERDILLMTHIVIGHPDMDRSLRAVEAMAAAGVDLVELQVPFSEPIADGPVILRANQVALDGGATVERCLRFAEAVTKRFDLPCVLMTYANVPFVYGWARFAKALAEIGIRGAIVPDLPHEEAEDHLAAMEAFGLAPILLFSPRTSDGRMREIAALSRGFVYCVARKGVTGAETDFSGELGGYLARCRAATDLPLAVGFGVKDAGDVDFLRGKADLAVVGSQTLRVMEERGVEALRGFLEGLRP